MSTDGRSKRVPGRVLDFGAMDVLTAPFIVFDGIDGAGKSTLVAATADLLVDRGFEVVVTRSPPREAVERPLYLRYMPEPSSGFRPNERHRQRPSSAHAYDMSDMLAT